MSPLNALTTDEQRIYSRVLAPVFGMDLLDTAERFDRVGLDADLSQKERMLLEYILEGRHSQDKDAHQRLKAPDGFLDQLIESHHALYTGKSDDELGKIAPETRNAAIFLYRMRNELEPLLESAERESPQAQQQVKDLIRKTTVDAMLRFFPYFHVRSAAQRQAVVKYAKEFSINPVGNVVLESSRSLARHILFNEIHQSLVDDGEIDPAERVALQAFMHSYLGLPETVLDTYVEEYRKEHAAMQDLVIAVSKVRHITGHYAQIGDTSFGLRISGILSRAHGLDQEDAFQIVRSYDELERIARFAFFDQDLFNIDKEQKEIITYVGERILRLRNRNLIDQVIENYARPIGAYITENGDKYGVVEKMRAHNLGAVRVSPDHSDVLDALNPHMVVIAQDIDPRRIKLAGKCPAIKLSPGDDFDERMHLAVNSYIRRRSLF